MVARLEPEAALRELVHLPQQVERALEHVREVEDRALLERRRYCVERDREHPPDAAREDDVEVAREREDHAARCAARSGRRRAGAASTPPATDSRARSCRGGIAAGLARVAVRRQEMRRHAVDQRADLRVAGRASSSPADSRSQLPHEQLIARMRDRSIREEPRRPPGTARSASCSDVAARRQTTSAVRSDGPLRQETIERVPGDESAIEERGQPFARPRDPELREHERDVGLVLREAGEDPQRSIERRLRRAAAPRSRRPSRSRDRDPPRAGTPAAATGRTRRSC